MRIPVFLAATIIALTIISSGCRVTLENENFKIENLEIVWGNWERTEPSPNRMLSMFKLQNIVKPLAWIAPSKTFLDDFQDGNINGWTRSYGYTGGSASFLISYSNYDLYNNLQPCLRYDGNFYLDPESSTGSVNAWVKYSLGSGVSGLNWIYMSYRVDARIQIATLEYYTKPYIKLSTGTVTYAPTSGTGGTIAYNFTISQSDVIVEFGIYIRVTADLSLSFYGIIDDVYVAASKEVFLSQTVTQFKVQCSSISASGKYVKATQTSSWNTCNVTVNVYHAVDSTSTWNLASTTTYSNAALPYTYSNWDSGWLNLLTGSYTTGSHTYYVKLEVKVRGIDLDGNIVENTAYTVISMTLTWQNCWVEPSITMEIIDGNLGIKYEYNPIHVTAATMIIILAVSLSSFKLERE